MAHANSGPAQHREEIRETAISRLAERHTSDELDAMTEDETVAAIDDVVEDVTEEVMESDDPPESEGESGERTNVSNVPSGEWADHTGPTDEWGQWLGQSDEAGQSERTNDGTPSGQMTTGSSRDNSATANMMGVPQAVERDTAGLGEEDVSDVPTGVWDASLETNGPAPTTDSARVNEADIADEDMPDGEWPNESDAERLSRASGPATNIYQNMQLGDNKWESKGHIERENSALSRHEVHEGLSELAQLDLIERDETARPTLYRMPE